MRKHQTVSALMIVLLFLPIALMGQQTATPRSLLEGTLSLLGANSLQKLDLSGSAEAIAGSTDDIGTFTASCNALVGSQLTLRMSQSSRTEVRQPVNAAPNGYWTDDKGTSHTIVPHNLYSPQSWFCPAIALRQILLSASLALQFQGTEEKNNVTLEHFVIKNVPAGASAQDQLIAHLSQIDLFLDPQTFRPVVLDFNTHPDGNAAIDIPIEIRYSAYTNVQGAWIPFRVEQYINSSLALTLQLQSATPMSDTTAGS